MESEELEDKDFEDKELEAKFERYISKREKLKYIEELKAQQPFMECSFIRNESIERFIMSNRDESILREIVNLRIISADIDDTIKSEFLKLFETHSLVKHTKLVRKMSAMGNYHYEKE
jgi:hypothetical protein